MMVAAWIMSETSPNIGMSPKIIRVILFTCQGVDDTDSGADIGSGALRTIDPSGGDDIGDYIFHTVFPIGAHYQYMEEKKGPSLVGGGRNEKMLNLDRRQER